MRYTLPCLILITLLHFLQFASQIAEAQTIRAVGTDATLDVATWNIEWFGSPTNGPSDARQLANVRAVIDQADIDLWGVQEISDPDDFNALLDGLGDGYTGVLATESGTQRIGFLYKTEVFSNVVVRHILSTFSEAFAGRPPLQLEADVTLGDETRRPFRRQMLGHFDAHREIECTGDLYGLVEPNAPEVFARDVQQ